MLTLIPFLPSTMYKHLVTMCIQSTLVNKRPCQTWPDRPYLNRTPYTNIFYPVAKLPVQEKINASQECICNERSWRIITGHNKNIKRTMTNNIRFLYVRIDPAKCDRAFRTWYDFENVSNFQHVLLM